MARSTYTAEEHAKTVVIPKGKPRASRISQHQTKVLKTMFKREYTRSRNALPKGMVKVLKDTPPRLPPNATEAEKVIMGALAENKLNIAFGLKSSKQSATMLKATESMQDDIAGPLKRDVNLSMQITHTDLVARMEKQLGTGE